MVLSSSISLPSHVQLWDWDGLDNDYHSTGGSAAGGMPGGPPVVGGAPPLLMSAGGPAALQQQQVNIYAFDGLSVSMRLASFFAQCLQSPVSL